MTEAQLDFYKRLARALALQFGSGCEVVVHDLEAADPSHSIVAIENGHVTGRRLATCSFIKCSWNHVIAVTSRASS